MIHKTSGKEMKMPTGASGADNNRLQKAGLLWEEYKYRHDLLWRITFQITVASVVLAIVPYTGSPEDLGIAALAPPLLAVGLVVLGIVVVLVERKLFQPVRNEYWRLQEDLFGINQNENFRGSPLNPLLAAGHTLIFFYLLFVLGICNFVYLVCTRYSDCC